MKFEVQVFVSCFAFGVAQLTSSHPATFDVSSMRCTESLVNHLWLFFSLNVFSRLFPRWICHMNPSLLGNLFVVNTKRDQTKPNNNIKSKILAIKSWASCCLYPLTFCELHLVSSAGTYKLYRCIAIAVNQRPVRQSQKQKDQKKQKMQ